MKIEFNDKSPIYLQIVEFIKKQIVSGELKGGDKLMSVRELSSHIKVNPNTIQRAYGELEREELLYTERGKGKFVTKENDKIEELKEKMATTILNNFVQEMHEIGFDKEDIVHMITNKIEK